MFAERYRQSTKFNLKVKQSVGRRGNNLKIGMKWKHLIDICSFAIFVREMSTTSQLITLTHQNRFILQWCFNTEIHWGTCEVNCLWKGNKYSGEEQSINMRVWMTQTHLSGYVQMISEHNHIRKQVSVYVNNLKEPPWVIKAVAAVTHWAHLLWTLTSTGRSWAWCTWW